MSEMALWIGRTVARMKGGCDKGSDQWRSRFDQGFALLSGGSALDFLSTTHRTDLWDLFTLPNLLAVVAVAAIAVTIKVIQGRRRNAAWLRGAANPRLRLYPGMAGGRRCLDALDKADEEFSSVVFEEFVRALYVRLHEARGQGELDCYSAYLTREARQHFPAVEDLVEVRDVALTGIQVAAVSGDRAGADILGVDLILQGRYTEVVRNRQGTPGAKTYLVAERWSLGRRAKADARTPANARDIACPQCGAPLPKVPARSCEICGLDFAASWSDWGLERVLPLMREKMPPEPMDFMRSCHPLSEHELPAAAVAALPDDQALCALDKAVGADGQPAFERPAFEARVRALFAAFEEAWAVRDASPLARLSTPGFHRQVESQLNLMRRERMQDFIIDERLEQIEIVRAARDFHYDKIDVRLSASCIEYVYSEREKADVLGSRSQRRRYSEYWTLVRERRPLSAVDADLGARPGLVDGPRSTHGDWKIHRIETAALYRG